MADESVENDIEIDQTRYKTLSSYRILQRKQRLSAGSNLVESSSNETPSDLEAVGLQESQSADVTLETVLENAEDEDLNPEGVDDVVADSQFSLHKLNERIDKIEATMQHADIPQAISSGLSVMKDQLEFVMEQMLLLTFLMLSKKPDFERIQQLYSMAQTLVEIKKDNVFIEGLKTDQVPNLSNLNWQSSQLQLTEMLPHDDVFECNGIASAHGSNEDGRSHQDELNDHLCYSPSKLLDQLMELKRDFCLLTNKTNELSARLLQQESQQTLPLLQEVQEKMKNIELAVTKLKENHAHMTQNMASFESTMSSIKQNIEQIMEEKVDQTHLDIQLSSKVDYKQLQRKASLDQILELQCRIDKKFCGLQRRINDNEKRVSEAIDISRNSLGRATTDEDLKQFKESVGKEIKSLHELVRAHMELTSDDCEAAGSRNRVLQHLTCLSCDNNCVMRTMEKAKVPKLPNAHYTTTKTPFITYELGAMRKAGPRYKYRKDKSAHTTNAWSDQRFTALTGLKPGIRRHVGGQHTTNNAKERFQKTKSHI